jgi:hypothetical protein
LINWLGRFGSDWLCLGGGAFFETNGMSAVSGDIENWTRGDTKTGPLDWVTVGFPWASLIDHLNSSTARGSALQSWKCLHVRDSHSDEQSMWLWLHAATQEVEECWREGYRISPVSG